MYVESLSFDIKSKIKDFPINIKNPWDLLFEIKNNKFENCQFEENENLKDKFPGVHFLPNSRLIVGKKCVIQPSVVINGTVILGDNVFIGSHSLIRGNVFIGNNSIIGSYNEISSSIIGKDTKISHRNDILDSIIGNKCWLASNVSIHNVRLDLKDIHIKWREQEVYISKSFGCIIENNVTIGIWAKIMPGAVIICDKTILGPCLISSNKITKFETLKFEL